MDGLSIIEMILNAEKPAQRQAEKFANHNTTSIAARIAPHAQWAQCTDIQLITAQRQSESQSRSLEEDHSVAKLQLFLPFQRVLNSDRSMFFLLLFNIYFMIFSLFTNRESKKLIIF